MFLFKQFLKALFLTPLPWLLLLVIVCLFWQRRWARKLLVFTTILIFLLHSGSVGYLMRYPLESRFTAIKDPRQIQAYDAIVVLTSGFIPAGGLIPFPTVDESMFRRLDEAWRLYRITPKPIVVSGGHVNPLTPPRDENKIACDYLRLWGVPNEHVIPEPKSRDTFESSVEVKQILERHNWKRYLLVTSAIHMPRSMVVFGSLVPEPVPAPADFTIRAADFTPFDLFPSESAARKILAAVHEYIGLVNYYWRTRTYQRS